MTQPRPVILPESKLELAPLKLRLVLALASWVAFSGFLTYIPQIGWRAAAAVLLGGASLALFYRFRIRSDPKVENPIFDAQVSHFDFTRSTIERADRAAVAWLTIAGAAHSILLAAIGGFQGIALDLDTRLSLLGAGILVVGFLCLAGSKFIAATRGQANRALAVARASHPLGTYFAHVYGKDEDSWEHSLPATTLFGLARIWIILGGTFLALGYFDLIF